MKQYLSLVEEVLENGERRLDRTKIGTISLFGSLQKYDLREGFPLVTTKKVVVRNVLEELMWFLKGSTNIYKDIQKKEKHTKIWDLWAQNDGAVGPIYGYQWVSWEKFIWNEEKKSYEKTHINQLQEAMDTIKNDPYSRRIVVSAWNVADINSMVLPPCHVLFQFYVVNGRLDCLMYQRSADLAIGVPYNIASYAALLMMMAQECNLIPGIFTHAIGDAHVYLNCIDGLEKQLKRDPYPLPKVELAKKSFWKITPDDFKFINYQHHPFIKFPVNE